MNIINSIKNFLITYVDLIFLSIYFFSLPIAHATSIQSISLGFFIIVFLIRNYRNLHIKSILFYKNILIVFSVLLILSILSLLFTPDIKESLKEIKSELIRSFIVMAIFFLYTILNDKKRIKYILYIIASVLLLHTFINIFIWYTHNTWPYRAGGLLDSGGGERFGIWATYAFAMSIAFLFSKYKFYVLPFIALSIVSIVANNTRATFIALILILFVYFLLFYKNRLIKYIITFSIIFSLLGFIVYSQNFPTRFNAYKAINTIKHLKDYSPSQYQTLEKKYKLGHSTVSRLAMWDSIILYRTQEPFIPKGYGRFLYKKSITETWQNRPENIPYRLYAQAHNEYLGTLYSLGILGLLAFLYFLYFNLKISYKTLKYSENTIFKIFGTFMFLGTIGFIVSLIFGSFFGDSEAKFFYPLYGILLGIYLKEKQT